MRTLQTLVFGHVADAAFARSCGIFVVATGRVSQFQPFMGVILSGTVAGLSQNAILANKSLGRSGHSKRRTAAGA